MNNINLDNCIKDYNGYKVISPDKTTNHLESEFKKIDMTVKMYVYPPMLNMNDVTMIVCDLVPNNEHPKNFIRRQLGKGLTAELSIASGIAELAERVAGGITGVGMNPDVYRKLCNIRGDKKRDIPEDATVLYKDEMQTFSQYNNSYNGTLVNDYWCTCQSLTRPDEKFVISEPFIETLRTHHGLCAGNTVEEAVIHGIGEIIERASMYDFLNNFNNKLLKNLKFIDIESIRKTNKKIDYIIDSFEKMNIDMKFFDYSIFGVPTIIANFNKTDKIYDSKKLPLGYRASTQSFVVGVSTSPEVAVSRCLLEYLQTGEVYHITNHQFLDYQMTFSDISVYNDFKFRPFDTWSFQDICPLWNDIDIGKTIYEYDDNNYIDISDIKSVYDKNILKEIHTITDIFESNNMEIFLRDKSVSMIDFPVVDVMCIPNKNSDNRLKNIFSPFVFYTDPRNTSDNDGRIFYNKYGYSMHYDNHIWKEYKKCSKLHKLNNNDMLDIAKNLRKTLYISYIQGNRYPSQYDVFKILLRIYLHTGMYSDVIDIANGILTFENKEYDMDALIAKIIACDNMNKSDESKQMRRLIKIIDKDISIDKYIESINVISEPIIKDICDFNCGENDDTCTKCFFNYIGFDKYV